MKKKIGRNTFTFFFAKAKNRSCYKELLCPMFLKIFYILMQNINIRPSFASNAFSACLLSFEKNELGKKDLCFY